MLASVSAACVDDGGTRPADFFDCDTCAIALHRVGTLSDAFEPGSLPDYMVHATLDRTGRLFTPSRDRTSVLVYDTLGELHAKLGRGGAGPNEFRSIRRVLIGPADSIFVSDWGLGRVTIYEPGLHLARMETMAHSPALVLSDGTFIVAEQIRTPEMIGQPVHVFDRDGSYQRSFGMDEPQHRPDVALLTTRLVAAASGGEIWAVAPGRYQLERWDPTTGTRKQSIAVESSWFEEVASFPADASTPPPAIIVGLWEGEDGLVWLVFRDAAVDWEPPQAGNAERRFDVDDYEREHDWVIEAVDPTTRAVVASRRFDQILWTRPPSTVIVTARVQAISGATFDVWRTMLNLRRR